MDSKNSKNIINILPKLKPKPKFVIKKWFPWHEYSVEEEYCGNEDKEKKEYHWSGAQSLENYNGSLVNSAMHGYGEYRWRYIDSDQFVTYEGNFYANRLHGYGVMSYPDGRTFTGLYNKDVRWGPGVELSVNSHASIGFWIGPRLIRLAWRPPTLKLFPDLITGVNGQEFLYQFRKVLRPDVINIGSSSLNAIDLLMTYGCDPKKATKLWPKIYSNCCTDPDSIFFNKDVFDQEYFKGNINSLEDAEVLECASVEELGDDMPKRYLTWNNSNLMIEMMKHCYRYEMQRPRGVNLEKILNGPRHTLRKDAKHEADCRSLLMASYLGSINLVAKFINRRNVCPDLTDIDGNSALMYAVCGDNYHVCEFLIGCGASLNCPNDQCYTPLGLSLMRYLIAFHSIGYRHSALSLLPPFKVETRTVQEEWVMNLQKATKLDSNTLLGKKSSRFSSKLLRTSKSPRTSTVAVKDITKFQKRHSSSGFKISISKEPSPVPPTIETLSVPVNSSVDSSATFMSLKIEEEEEDAKRPRIVNALERIIDDQHRARARAAKAEAQAELKRQAELKAQAEKPQIVTEPVAEKEPQAETKPQGEEKPQAETKPEAETKEVEEKKKLEPEVKTEVEMKPHVEIKHHIMKKIHTEMKSPSDIKDQSDTKTHKVKMSEIEGFDDDRRAYLALKKEYINKVNEELATPASKPRYIFQVDDMFAKASKHEDIIIPFSKTSRRTLSIDDDEVERRKYESMEASRKTIAELIKAGADPKLVRCPWPAILMAIKTGSPEIVRLIAQSGADVNECFPEQLDYMAIDIIMSEPLTSDNVEIIKTLIECGADVKHTLPYSPATKTVSTKFRFETPTLFHVLFLKLSPTGYDWMLVEDVLFLLLQHGCDPFVKFDGQSAIEMAMNKDLKLLNVFANQPNLDLNRSINTLNHTMLTKLFHPDFSENVCDYNNPQGLISDLVLHGADPLIPCEDGDKYFDNLFCFIQDVFDLTRNINKKSSRALQKSGSKIGMKKKNLKSFFENQFVTNVELLMGYTRLGYMRRLHAQLMNELVELLYKFKTWQWRMIVKEHKNKLNFGLWLTTTRCFEIWDIFQNAKNKKYQDETLLHKALCLLLYYQKKIKEDVEIGSSHVTLTEKVLIEAEVKKLIKEHKKRVLRSTMTNVTEPSYFIPELCYKELQDEKYKVCFECLMPLDTQFPEQILECIYCKLVSFCTYDCVASNNNRLDCHPCSEKLMLFYCPSTSGERSNEQNTFAEPNISAGAIEAEERSRRSSVPNINAEPSRHGTIDSTSRRATIDSINPHGTTISNIFSRRATITSDSSLRTSVASGGSRRATATSFGSRRSTADFIQLAGKTSVATNTVSMHPSVVVHLDDKGLKGTQSTAFSLPSLSSHKSIRGVGYAKSVISHHDLASHHAGFTSQPSLLRTAQPSLSRTALANQSAIKHLDAAIRDANLRLKALRSAAVDSKTATPPHPVFIIMKRHV